MNIPQTGRSRFYGMNYILVQLQVQLILENGKYKRYTKQDCNRLKHHMSNSTCI